MDRIGDYELWIASASRAIRTFFQALFGLIFVGLIMDGVDWITTLATSLVIGIISMLTCMFTGLPEAEEDGIITIDPSTQQCHLQITNRKKFVNNKPMRFVVDPYAFTELDVKKVSREKE